MWDSYRSRCVDVLGVRVCVCVLGARVLGGGRREECCMDVVLREDGHKDVTSDDVVERLVDDDLVDVRAGDGGLGLKWGWCTLRVSCAWIQSAVRSRVLW